MSSGKKAFTPILRNLHFSVRVHMSKKTERVTLF